jgi:3-phosphoshikimate 1-carboxyvinyltransferase
MKWIRPSEIRGRLQAPPSKSLMIRATASALLGRGESRIMNPSGCDDALAALRMARALGARVENAVDAVVISGGAGPVSDVLDCGESGLCMRMFTPIAALSGRETRITGEGSLTTRPMRMMENPLRNMGVRFRSTDGHAPLMIQGPIQTGNVRIDGSLSSQFLSGLLTALPLFHQDSEVRVDNLRSRPYAEMTLEVLSRFGVAVDADPNRTVFRIPGGQSYRSTTFAVEGDWSGAAFILSAAAICGEATVDNLREDSLQADQRVLEALRSSGALVFVAGNSVTVCRSDPKAFDFDATDCPDLFPPLAALALNCPGTCRIYGASRLRHKESDRASALIKELSGLGADIALRNGWLEIAGPARIGTGTVNSHGDHRIAMAGALAGLVSEGGVGVVGSECVTKSYPRFFEDLRSLGGDVS